MIASTKVHESNHPSPLMLPLRASVVPLRTPFLTLEEVENLPEPEWLVEGILPDGCAAMLVGSRESFKTFIALDLALSIASGRDWHGHKVRPGAVVYVIGEGTSGLRARTQAWREKHGVAAKDISCLFHGRSLQVHLEHERQAFIDSVRNTLTVPPALIVLDTLSRCFVGMEENASKDMSLFNAGVDDIRRQTGAAVLVIHHAGWGDGHGPSTRERGSTALGAAMDTIMFASRTGASGMVRVTCNKQRDAARFDELEFRATAWTLATGSSLVLDLQGTPGPQPADLERDRERAKALKFAKQVKSLGEPDLKTVAEAQGLSRNAVSRYAKKVQKEHPDLLEIKVVKAGRTKKHVYVSKLP